MSRNRKPEVDAVVRSIDFAKYKYQIEFQTTAGAITLDLWPDVAEGHCKNIIALTQIGFYDGILFHRVIKGFVIQAGCPEGRGTGGPGYTIRAEFNDRPHEAGVLSMARTNDPHSAGSQFFLCLGRVPHLDRQYTGFGKTADPQSLNVVLAIGNTPTDAQDRPKTEQKILKGTVKRTEIGA
jgi:cyclophilin family peptidyl-prolyl cis-trans isomerase